MTDEKWVVYLVRCADNSLYCGISNDFERRLEKHNSGKGAQYTKSRKPVELAGISPEIAKSETLKLEYRIKRTAAGNKIAELEKTGRQISIKRDLELLAKEIRTLGKKVERIAKAIEITGPPQRKRTHQNPPKQKPQEILDQKIPPPSHRTESPENQFTMGAQ